MKRLWLVVPLLLLGTDLSIAVENPNVLLIFSEDNRQTHTDSP